MTFYPRLFKRAGSLVAVVVAGTVLHAAGQPPSTAPGLAPGHVFNVRDHGAVGDGVHFRGAPGRDCHDVNIIGCQFYTGDDAIPGRYWDNVVIADCFVDSSCTATGISADKELCLPGFLSTIRAHL